MRRLAAGALLLAVAPLLALLALRGPGAPAGTPETTPAPASSADVAAPEGAPGAEGAAEDPARVAERERRFQRVVKSMWWHQPRFSTSESLGLRPGQLEAMDGICLRMLRRRQELRRNLRAGQPRARTAIESLDLDGARRQIAELEAGSGELALLETRLTVDVLAVLDRAQLEALRRDHGALLKRPWLKTLGGDQRRPGRRPAAGSGGDASGSARSRPAS